jgi:hypothetical protein
MSVFLLSGSLPELRVSSMLLRNERVTEDRQVSLTHSDLRLFMIQPLQTTRKESKR